MRNSQTIFNKYRVFFEEFLRKTDQKRNINNWLIKNFPRQRNKIKILSIGAGSGEDIIEFLKYLKLKGPNFDFFYLDPSKKSFALFREKCQELNLLKYISHVEFNRFESSKFKENFDIIIASHVFYYICDWEKSLNKLLAILNKEGVAFVIIQSKNSDNFMFRYIFEKNIFGKNYKERCGEELIKIIKKLGLRYKEQKITSILNTTATIFKNKGVSLSGRRLLSFLLRTNYNDLSQKLKTKINEYLIRHTKRKNSNRQFNLIDNYITIYK